MKTHPDDWRPQVRPTAKEIAVYSRRIEELNRLDQAMIWYERVELTLIMLLIGIVCVLAMLCF